MPGEESSSTLLLEVDGSPLADDAAARLTSGYVDDSLNVPDLFVLRFSDVGTTVLDKARIKIGSAVRLLVQRSGQGSPALLMSGEVTGLETEVGEDGVHTVVRGYDHSHRFFRGRRVEAYLQASASDIARKVAQRAGVKAGTINHPGPPLDHVSQDGLNDWDFLRRLAADVGADVKVVDGGLDFGKPTDATTAPAGDQSSRQDPLVIEMGVNLISLRASVTAADQVPEVEVRGWDVNAKKAVVGVAPAATRSAKLDQVSPAGLAGTFGSPKWVESRSRNGTQQQCETAAKAIAERLAGTFAELEGVVRGNPALKAGVAVALAGVGKPFEGRYTLSATRHEFWRHGYRTWFAVSNSSERSLYGVAAGASDHPGRMSGVLSATVTDVKDPDGRGRVKVSFPVMSDSYVSWWARTVQAGAGRGRGALVLPEVGDEVLVAFGQADIAEPYVLGGLYNGVDQPTVAWKEHVDTTDGSIKRRAFVSRTGMVVEMVESAQDQKLTLSTSGGAQRITLLHKPSKAIEIISEGPVTVTAKEDVTVTAQKNISVSTSTGDVSIKGKKVTIEATTDVLLNGVNVKATAKASAELGGAMVKVAASGMAELSASGITTVKGSLVKIN